MIKHYAIITGVADENGDIVYRIEHGELLKNFLGVAYDTDTNEWLSATKLEIKQGGDEEAIKFLRGLYLGLPTGLDIIQTDI